MSEESDASSSEIKSTKTEAKPAASKSVAAPVMPKPRALAVPSAATKPKMTSVEREVTKSVKHDKQRSLPIAIIILLAFGSGFFGGWVGNEANSDSLGNISSTDTRNQIVLQESEVIADIAEQAKDTVVSIDVTSQTVQQNFFFGPQSFDTNSAGTGIILSSDGIVVTNKHVIGETDGEYAIVTSDGREFTDISVLGRDPFNDIAFLKINGVNDLTPATLADSSQVRVGDKVIAIGNALGRFDNTVTTGIISGLGRPVVAGDATSAASLQNLFQTDAAINPGNSGGPLFNINGEVIGINTAVAGDAQNIGFSIPSNDVKPLYQSVSETGELQRPYLGVRYVTLTRDNREAFVDQTTAETGALIVADEGISPILDDSPAQKAGLQAGDVIQKINGTDINEDNSLVTIVSQYQVGEILSLQIDRGGEQQFIELTLEAVPDSL